MTVKRCFAALALSAVAVTAASAQSGGLRVRVIDNADKSAVIGAAVTLSNVNKLVATSTILTDVDGLALFPVLRAGSGYVVTIIMDGYAGIRQDATVSIGSTRDLAIALAPEHVETEVVIGEKTQVDLDQNETATKFSAEFIDGLPVAGNFYQNVLALAPGVQDPDGDGNPNVNGSRERDFKAQVGGISNVDPLTGLALNVVTNASIEELTIITAGAGAEFGRAQGGFAEIIQKQGSNDFEGVVGMLYSSKLLDGRGASNTPSRLVPDFYHYEPSAQVSGPFVKDKLWYRVGVDVIRREDALVLGGGGSLQTLGTERDTVDAQLTWQVSNRNKLAFNYRSDPLTQTRVGLSAITPVESTSTVELGGPTYELTWTAPYSPSLLVDSRVAYQDTRLKITPTQSGFANTCVEASSFLTSAQCFDVQQGQTSGSAPTVWSDQRQRFTMKTGATYYKGRLWGANHQFKFGLVVENERYFRALRQDPTFLKSESLAAGGGQQGPTQFYTITASLDPESRQTAVGTTWGVYGEDVLRPVSNLSLTVGLRIEQEDLRAAGFRRFDPQADSDAFIEAARPLQLLQQKVVLLQNSFVSYEDLSGARSSIEAQFGIPVVDGPFTTQLSNWTRVRQPEDLNIHNTNIAPRLSIAWDPWNDGKTKFSLSAGRYYNTIPLNIAVIESEPVLANFDSTADSNSIAFEPSFGYTTVDRNLKTPYSDEYTFKVERNFMQENSISLTYIHKDAKYGVQDININQVPGDYGKCAFQQSSDGKSLEPSPQTGQVLDVHTGAFYQDDDPGNGDGRLDDCTGERIVAEDQGGGGPTAPSATGFVQRPDGVADNYVLNPAWGDIFEIGNYNSSTYDGVTLEFVRRQYKNWEMQASYTWSEAIGDAEDFNQILGDDRSTLQDEAGYLSFDRRHSLKVLATTITPWGFRLGGIATWQSGLPYSLLFRSASDSNSLPAYEGFSQQFTSVRTRYVTHQRNDQRNKSAWNFDANLVKDINLAKGVHLQLQAKILNLLNQDTYVVTNEINTTNQAVRRFGRQYELELRLSF